MYKIKQLIKKVLIRLHILKRPEPIVQVQEEKKFWIIASASAQKT